MSGVGRPTTCGRLFGVIEWMVNLPKPLEVDFSHEIEQYEEENTCLTNDMGAYRTGKGPG